MAQKYEKIKLGLPAYLTFLAIFVSIVVMIFLIIPPKHKRIMNKYNGTYEVEVEGKQEKETKYYGLEKNHIIDTCSFNRLKKNINKDQYTYVIYGDTSSETVKRNVVDLDEVARDAGISKVYVVDKSDLNDDKMEYLRLMLREVNSDMKSTEKMAAFDVYVFKNGEAVNCYSREEYKDLSLKMVAKHHIFNNK